MNASPHKKKKKCLPDYINEFRYFFPNKIEKEKTANASKLHMFYIPKEKLSIIYN